nr:MAG TPA_asm: hypothetical protein [Caudoviricetes sp.]
MFASALRTTLTRHAQPYPIKSRKTINEQCYDAPLRTGCLLHFVKTKPLI